MPQKTDRPAAPEKQLKMVKCKCKQHCDTKRCTCRKTVTVFCGMLRMSWNQLYKCREVQRNRL
ncbi:hypothetical protein DPMN_020317 [Dreissena polymorpha]|uniref:Uncharacterized protein n=1 Tax=Dreissena polymorpha TaxID=45954 RepID=A0A9D4S839_DREPO|nr:hypothetical protein DPMN_020317 [Dreissena polymorpha]